VDHSRRQRLLQLLKCPARLAVADSIHHTPDISLLTAEADCLYIGLLDLATLADVCGHFLNLTDQHIHVIVTQLLQQLDGLPCDSLAALPSFCSYPLGQVTPVWRSYIYCLSHLVDGISKLLGDFGLFALAGLSAGQNYAGSIRKPLYHRGQHALIISIQVINALQNKHALGSQQRTAAQFGSELVRVVLACDQRRQPVFALFGSQASINDNIGGALLEYFTVAIQQRNPGAGVQL